jgi:branched-chain amino acid transport system substrate-binding protein
MGAKKAVCIVTDWTPGAEASKVFYQHFIKGGGQVLDTLKVPLANPDFAPFLQRARDLQPDTLFVFVPADRPERSRGNSPNADSIDRASN